MKLVYLKSALKCDSFGVTIGIKIPFFRVLVTIELGCSLLQFVTTNCLTLVKDAGEALLPTYNNNNLFVTHLKQQSIKTNTQKKTKQNF